jgi:hypothetical protein
MAERVRYMSSLPRRPVTVDDAADAPLMLAEPLFVADDPDRPGWGYIFDADDRIVATIEDKHFAWVMG